MDKEYSINLYSHSLGITVTIKTADNQMAGAAETSIMEGKDTFYFNRIIIQPKFRGKGYGSILLDKLLSEFNSKGYNLICEVNPYGPLNDEQLRDWYKRHGFVDNPDIPKSLIFRGKANG